MLLLIAPGYAQSGGLYDWQFVTYLSPSQTRQAGAGAGAGKCAVRDDFDDVRGPGTGRSGPAPRVRLPAGLARGTCLIRVAQGEAVSFRRLGIAP